MVVKIENYEGTADTFTFQYNPLSFDSGLSSNSTITEIGFQRHHILVSGAGIRPVAMILTGHFSGTNRWTNYRNLGKHFGQNDKLKKLFFEDDKFYLGVGSELKKTHSGGRTNFIDYVFNFTSIIGILFGNTEKTSGTNGGNTRTYVTELVGEVVNGSNDVVLEDALGSKITINNAVLGTGNTLRFELVRMVDAGSGIKVSEYGIISVDSGSGYVQVKRVTTEGGFGLLQIDIGANVSTISTTNLSSVVVKFRDGYVD